jgi:putative transposase
MGRMMEKLRFKEEQIVSIVRETDRDSVCVVAKPHGVIEQAIYT